LVDGATIIYSVRKKVKKYFYIFLLCKKKGLGYDACPFNFYRGFDMDMEKVRDAMRKVNLKIMAEELEVSVVTLYNVRDDKHIPRLDTAIKIADYLRKLSEGCTI